MNPMMMFLNPLNGYNPMNLSQSNTRNDSNMSSLVGNINFNKYSNDFLTFVYKLHNDIITYHKNVNDTLDLMKEVKIYVIQYIEKLINNQISDNFSIDIYGSFASDLSIESSDIDIKIRLKVNEHQYENEYRYGHEKSRIQLDLDNFIMIIVKNFNELKIFENVIPINTATVPIIKIVCDPRTIADDDNQMRLEEFKNSEYYKNYKFNKEEIEKIKIDITFLDMINKNSINFNSTNSLLNNNQMSSVEFAKNNLILYPEIKPLLQIIKRFLQINKLNSCFNGILN
jgi:DNA polymerase sigma